jgi:hypothetical protein
MSFLNVQEPPVISKDRSMNNYYKTYGADGSISKNKFAVYDNIDREKQIYTSGDIRLQTNLGSIINGYQNSIIRPFDSVSLPTDLKRTTGLEVCKGPDYAASKFQQWCSPEVAINYYGMRPILEPNQYNNLLRKLFSKIVENNTNSTIQRNITLSGSNKWSSVFCDDSSDNLMEWVLSEVQKAVLMIPEMKKNGPYQYEEFHYTDPQFFEFITSDGKMFYKIVFNLYNALRSVSSLVETSIEVRDNKKFVIVHMSFVNDKELASDSTDTHGIQGYNVGLAGSNKQIDIDVGPSPTLIDWNYGNTLLKQEFNSHGFFDPTNNIKVTADMSENLRNKVRSFEKQSNSYLMPAGSPAFSGLVRTDKDNYEYGPRLLQKPNSYANNVYVEPQVVYNQQGSKVVPTRNLII